MAAKGATTEKSSTNTNAGTIDAEAKTGKEIASEFGNAGKGLGQIEEGVAHLRRLLSQQAEGVEAAEEARRRSHDKQMYDLAQERQKVKDEHTREDADREAAHKKRESEIADSEKEICALLGVKPKAGDDKLPTRTELRDAFTKKIQDTEKAAEEKGKKSAEEKAASDKALEEAKGATASALLTQENKHLKERVTALEKQNAELLANQQKVVGDMKDVATGALNASAGVQKNANESMSAAVQGGRAPGQR